RRSSDLGQQWGHHAGASLSHLRTEGLRRLWHGLLTVPLGPTAGLLLVRETFGQREWHGRETVPQPGSRLSAGMFVVKLLLAEGFKSRQLGVAAVLRLGHCGCRFEDGVTLRRWQLAQLRRRPPLPRLFGRVGAHDFPSTTESNTRTFSQFALHSAMNVPCVASAW